MTLPPRLDATGSGLFVQSLGSNGSSPSIHKRSDGAGPANWDLEPSPPSLHSCAGAQLCVDPRLEVVARVEDAAAQAETAGAGAEVPPVPQGRDGSAEELGGFGDREQFGLAA